MMRGGIALAATLALIGAVAYAAVGSPFYSLASDNALISNQFTAADATPTSLGSVAFAVVCTPSHEQLTCAEASPAATGSAYVLTARVGADEASAGPVSPLPLSPDPAQRLETVWAFATGGTKFALHDNSPPIIACPSPPVNGDLTCAPVLPGQSYPQGTPIYEDVLN